MSRTIFIEFDHSINFNDPKILITSKNTLYLFQINNLKDFELTIYSHPCLSLSSYLYQLASSDLYHIYIYAYIFDE